MDVFPKFIIETDPEEGDCLIIAKCTYHKQLATDVSKVKGGGWWRINSEKKTVYLHGESHDFGRAKIEDIADCVKRKKVFRNSGLYAEWDSDYKLFYDNDCGDIIDLQNYKNDEN
jgi:hypothetical protein